MIEAIKKDGYSVVRLERKSDDYHLFHTARTRCFTEKDISDFPGVAAFAQSISTPQKSGYYWQRSFARAATYFVLLHQPKGYLEPEPAGIIDVDETNFDGTKCALLESLHVIKAHRGNHRSDLLFDAAVEFIVNERGWPLALAYVDPSNEHSKACCRRNGFATDGSMIYLSEFKKEGLIFTRSMDDLRTLKPAPKPPQALALSEPA